LGHPKRALINGVFKMLNYLSLYDIQKPVSLKQVLLDFWSVIDCLFLPERIFHASDCVHPCKKFNFIETVIGQIQTNSFTCSCRMKTCYSPSTWSCRFWELRPWSLGLPSRPKTVQEEITVKINRSLEFENRRCLTTSRSSFVYCRNEYWIMKPIVNGNSHFPGRQSPYNTW